jgi:hypothetical protein
MKLCGKDLRFQGRIIRVARLDGDGYQFLADPDEAVATIRESGLPADLFTFTQKLPDTMPKYDYHVEWDNIAALRVSSYDQWWTRQINDKTRNMVRRAGKRGVTLKEVPFDEDLVRGISVIYNESPIRQGKPFWNYGKDVDTVRREAGTFLARSVFIGAYCEGALIGFAKLVSDEDRSQMALMHILSMITHRNDAPTNGLIAQAVRSCADRGIPYLIYSKFSYGKKQRDSLSDFKQHNGFQRIDVPRYYIPLTLRGSLALRLSLHHKLADRVPEPILARLRSLRSLWYQRRSRVAKEAL